MDDSQDIALTRRGKAWRVAVVSGVVAVCLIPSVGLAPAAFWDGVAICAFMLFAVLCLVGGVGLLMYGYGEDQSPLSLVPVGAVCRICGSVRCRCGNMGGRLAHRWAHGESWCLVA